MVSMSSRIRRARLSQQLSQAALAASIGVDRSAVTQWENAKGTCPSTAHLAQIAIRTGVCFEWLATGRGAAQAAAGQFDAALMPEDFAQDELESQALLVMRRLSAKKRKAAVQILEILAG